MAKSVLCYDVADDGAVVYSDGGTLRRVGRDGGAEKLATGAWIDGVVIVPPAGQDGRR